MKNLILSIFCLVMAACGPEKYSGLQAVTPVRAAVHGAQEKVASAQSHAKVAGDVAVKLEAALPLQTPELHDLVSQLRSEIDALTKDLLDGAEALRVTQLKVDELERDAGKIITERNAAVTAKAVVERRYGKLKFGLCASAAAGALYLLLQFKAILAFAGPYAWAAFVVGPAATFAFFWKLIDWVL